MRVLCGFTELGDERNEKARLPHSLDDIRLREFTGAEPAQSFDEAFRGGPVVVIPGALFEMPPFPGNAGGIRAAGQTGRPEVTGSH